MIKDVGYATPYIREGVPDIFYATLYDREGVPDGFYATTDVQERVPDDFYATLDGKEGVPDVFYATLDGGEGIPDGFHTTLDGGEGIPDVFYAVLFGRHKILCLYGGCYAAVIYIIFIIYNYNNIITIQKTIFIVIINVVMLINDKSLALLCNTRLLPYSINGCKNKNTTYYGYIL